MPAGAVLGGAMPNRARETARQLLRRLGLQAPPVPDGVVYSLGLRIVFRLSDDLPDRHAGMTFRPLPDRAYIEVRRDLPPPRRRWTLFHEIGHVLLHPGLAYCSASGVRESLIEREADGFVAEFLMPEAWIVKDTTEPGWQLWHLAQRYQVSRTAMEWRLRQLGIRQ